MSTQALLDKIGTASKESVSTIESEAKAQVKAINDSVTAEVAKIASDAIVASEKAAAAVERATLAKARQSGKLLVQTEKRAAFDDIMAAAEKAIVNGDAEKAQKWADKRADLEMHLSKQLG